MTPDVISVVVFSTETIDMLYLLHMYVYWTQIVWNSLNISQKKHRKTRNCHTETTLGSSENCILLFLYEDW